MLLETRKRFQTWLAPKEISDLDREGFVRAQRLAVAAVEQVARDLQPGWTEQRASRLVDAYLKDMGVEQFFHHSFAWFGERTRFDGIRRYAEFAPTTRVLQEGEVFILDTAPIVEGYICDIGYTDCKGENRALDKALAVLWHLRESIPGWATEGTGAELYRKVTDCIHDSGFECAHYRYPFRVLGHRVHRMAKINQVWGQSKILNFGLSSFVELSSRMLWDQLLNEHHERPLSGLWAIEPHLGTRSPLGAGFGAKFEEILCVTEAGASWLTGEACLPERP